MAAIGATDADRACTEVVPAWVDAARLLAVLPRDAIATATTTGRVPTVREAIHAAHRPEEDGASAIPTAAAVLPARLRGGEMPARRADEERANRVVRPTGRAVAAAMARTVDGTPIEKPRTLPSKLPKTRPALVHATQLNSY